MHGNSTVQLILVLCVPVVILLITSDVSVVKAETSAAHWLEWQAWRNCTPACGVIRRRIRIRLCSTNKYWGGADSCKGSTMAQEPCDPEPCVSSVEKARQANMYRHHGLNINQVAKQYYHNAATTTTTTPVPVGPGTWSEWGSWETCRPPCGRRRTKTRMRTCSSGSYKSTGPGACPGSPVDMVKCTGVLCHHRYIRSAKIKSSNTFGEAGNTRGFNYRKIGGKTRKLLRQGPKKSSVTPNPPTPQPHTETTKIPKTSVKPTTVSKDSITRTTKIPKTSIKPTTVKKIKPTTTSKDVDAKNDEDDASEDTTVEAENGSADKSTEDKSSNVSTDKESDDSSTNSKADSGKSEAKKKTAAKMKSLKIAGTIMPKKASAEIRTPKLPRKKIQKELKKGVKLLIPNLPAPQPHDEKLLIPEMSDTPTREEKFEQTAMLLAAWTTWQEWDSCLPECGDTRNRIRKRTCMLSGLASDSCIGGSVDSVTCVDKPCDDKTDHAPTKPAKVKNGSADKSTEEKSSKDTSEKDSDNSSTSTVDSSKSGAKKKTTGTVKSPNIAEVIIPKKVEGKILTPKQSAKILVPEEPEITMPNQHAPQPHDEKLLIAQTSDTPTQVEKVKQTAMLLAAWTDWQEWDSCLPECGDTRNRIRKRTCMLNGLASDSCIGGSVDSVTCVDKPCDVKTTVTVPTKPVSAQFHLQVEPSASSVHSQVEQKPESKELRETISLTEELLAIEKSMKPAVSVSPSQSAKTKVTAASKHSFHSKPGQQKLAPSDHVPMSAVTEDDTSLSPEKLVLVEEELSRLGDPEIKTKAIDEAVKVAGKTQNTK